MDILRYGLETLRARRFQLLNAQSVRAVQLRLEPSKLASVKSDICGVDGLCVGMRTIVEDECLVMKDSLIREDSLEDRPIPRHNSNKLKPVHLLKDGMG